MAIRKITPRSILSGALTENLNIDSGTLYVDTSANRVGVATTSPTTALSVVGSANITSTSSNSFKVRNTVAGTSALSQISLGNDADADLLYIQALSTTYTSAGVAIQNGAVINGEGPGGLNLAATQAPIRFFSGGDTERMRLDSNGHLGLGVTPSATWSLGGGKALQLPSGSLLSYSTTDLHIAQNSFFNGTNWVYTNTGTATLQSQLSGEFQWNSVASGSAGSTSSFTRRMTLSASGRLGLGNSNPSQLLHLEVSSGDIYQQIQSGANLVYVGYEASRDVGVIQSNNALTFDMGNSYVERMRLDAAGNLGLGVTPSTSTLFKTLEIGTVGNTIAGRAGNSTLVMGANWVYNSGFKYANNGTASQYETTGGAHYWYNAASGTATNPITFTQAMTLNASGNLGIGISSPSMKLDVSSGATTSTAIFTSTATTAYDPTTSASVINARLTLFGGNATNSYNAIRFTNSGSFENFFGAVQSSAGTGQFVWGGYNGSSYGEWMRLDSSANLGLGVTPSAWQVNNRAIQLLEGYASISSNNSQGCCDVAFNCFNGGSAATSGWKYTNTGVAVSLFQQQTGAFKFLTAASGTAGNTISFTQAMTLDASGRLGIGTTSPSRQLQSTINVATAYSSSDFDTASNQLYLTNTNTTTNSFTGIQMDVGGNSQAAISAVRVGDGQVAVTFGTRVAGNRGERMRLDSSGNLGLGVTPSASTSNYRTLQIGDGNNSYSMFGQRVAGASEGFMGWNVYGGSNTTTLGTGFYYRNTGDAPTLYTQNAKHTWWNAASGTAGNAITFTQAMTLDSSGNLLVGTTSQLGTGKVAMVQTSGGQVLWLRNENASTPYGIVVEYTGASPNNTVSQYLYCNDTTALRMELRSNGGIANYQANDTNLSDSREKKNIELAPNYLNKICQIPVKTFLYNDQTDTDLNLGVIAQDVEAICPELIMESNWANKDEAPKIRKSIYQTDLQYALMKCIQEQQALIESLTTRLTALENK